MSPRCPPILKKFQWWEFEISQALASRLNLVIGFLRLETSLGSLHYLSLKIPSLFRFSSLNRSSISLVSQPHSLDLTSSPLGLVWSHNLSKPISQSPLGSQVSTRILGAKNLLDKSYTQTLALRIPLSPS